MGEFEVHLGDMDVELLTRARDPILHWSWPRNNFTDGQTYVWPATGRPVVIGGAFLLPREGVAYYEFTSLAPQAVVCRRGGEPVWTPPANELKWHPLDGVPEPSDAPRRRLSQMRSLAKRFEGVARMGPPRYPPGSRWELRLLPSPIHRYADPPAGIVDGAVFVLTMGTDPQLIVLLEARQTADRHDWAAAFSRLSGFELIGSFDGQELWSSPAVENGHAQDSVWHLSRPLDAVELFPVRSGQ
jgi:hypothetical protein